MKNRDTSGSPSVFRRGGCVTILHTCDINVVLNAMVKVNQAAILLASPGQPRHQPSKAFLLQSICNQGTTNGKKQKIFKTRINPSSLPGSSPVAPRWRAPEASRESVSNFQVIQRCGKINIHSRAASRPASPPRRVLYSTMVAPAVRARLRGLFWCRTWCVSAPRMFTTRLITRE